MTEPTPLAAAALRRCCDPDGFDFATTDALEPLDDSIGQQRAVEAVRFGVKLELEERRQILWLNSPQVDIHVNIILSFRCQAHTDEFFVVPREHAFVGKGRMAPYDFPRARVIRRFQHRGATDFLILICRQSSQNQLT